MTYETAIQALQAGLAARAADINAGRTPTFGIDQIKAIARGLSVDLPASVDTFVFYSGSYLPEKATANDAARSLATQSARVGIIDNTELGKFLLADEFTTAMRQLDPSGAALFGAGLSDAQIGSTLWGEAPDCFGAANDNAAWTELRIAA